MDVPSLCTNIPHKEGIKAFETTLKRNSKSTRVIITFLKLLLTLNNFIFNCKNYLQIKRCAMWTKCAPTYTNIFMGIYEGNCIYPRWIKKVHPSIKFDFNYSSNSVNFIHTTVKNSSMGELSGTLFKKERDCQTYLHRKIRTPGVFKTQYFICPSPTSKTNMHRIWRFQSQLWHSVEKTYR